VYKFVSQHVLSSHRVQKYFMSQAAQAVARAPVLDYIEAEKLEGGKVAWVQPTPRAAKAS
jgi:GR25 family glycosyltransferase involved in LPS biosynthesis